MRTAAAGRQEAYVITVSEEAIARAIVLTLERARLVVEGAGALGVAAILDEQVTAEGVTAVVLSGGGTLTSTSWAA